MKGKNLIMCGLCACIGFIGGEVRAYAKREKPTTGEKTVSLVNAAKHVDKGSITEYTQRLQEAGYKDYSRTIDEKPSGTPGEVPYVISPDEFGELEDYTKVIRPIFDQIANDAWKEVTKT